MWVEVTDAAVAVHEIRDAAAPGPDALVAAASHAIPNTGAR